jgi:AcrR family transcriptional regulator
LTDSEGDVDEASGLPPSVAAVWGLPEPRRKGPQRGLSVARIVEAAVHVASTEGLGAVSMARVAADLGASTMSLYRYVGAKEELTELMVDAGLGLPPEPPAPGGWRPGLAQWAWGVLAVYRRHPWVLQVPITMPPITPNNIAWMERGLYVLRDAGLPEEQKLLVVLLVGGFVRNDATLSANIAAATSDSWASKIATNYGALLDHLTTPDTHPSVRAALDAGAFAADGADPAAGFAFGLERVLDGVQALIAAQR